MDMRFSNARLLGIRRWKTNDHDGALCARQLLRWFAASQDRLRQAPISAPSCNEKTMTFLTFLSCTCVLGVLWTLNVLTLSGFGFLSIAAGATVLLLMQFALGASVKDSRSPERLWCFARAIGGKTAARISHLIWPFPSQKSCQTTRTATVLWSVLLPKLTCPVCHQTGQVQLISTLEEDKSFIRMLFSGNLLRPDVQPRKTLGGECLNYANTWCGIRNLKRIAGLS